MTEATEPTLSDVAASLKSLHAVVTEWKTAAEQLNDAVHTSDVTISSALLLRRQGEVSEKLERVVSAVAELDNRVTAAERRLDKASQVFGGIMKRVDSLKQGGAPSGSAQDQPAVS